MQLQLGVKLDNKIALINTVEHPQILLTHQIRRVWLTQGCHAILIYQLIENSSSFSNSKGKIPITAIMQIKIKKMSYSSRNSIHTDKATTEKTVITNDQHLIVLKMTITMMRGRFTINFKMMKLISILAMF